MLATNTPVTRVRLERFGNPSVALVRCLGVEGGPVPDQTVYEPLFRGASDVLSDYRGLLRVKSIVPEELAKISADSKQKAAPPESKMRKPATQQK